MIRVFSYRVETKDEAIIRYWCVAYHNSTSRFNTWREAIDYTSDSSKTQAVA